MTMQNYTTPAGRINRMKGEILGHAIPVEVFALFGQQRPMPKNVGSTVIYRRWLPTGATITNGNTINRWSVDPNAHLLDEGVTPLAEGLTPQDITVSLQQYGVLYGLTDRTVDLYEDDVPAEMKQQTGERIGLLREMIRYGVVKGATNAYYQGGSSRGAVNGALSVGKLRIISRNLQANHAKRITSVLSPEAAFGSTSVEASYVAVAHTDTESDWRALPGFKTIADYAQRKVLSPYELGTWENFRVILSPELNAYANAGVSVGSTGMFSTGGSTIDVYPIVVLGQDAWGTVALRGENALNPTYIPPGQKTKEDPLGQRGFIGASFYNSAVRTNEGWMAVYEVGITATPT